MSIQMKTYKFQLCPTKEQEVTLDNWLGATRFIYNLCLEYKTTAYKANGTSISKNDIQKELTIIRNETDWLKTVHSQTIQDVTDRLFTAYDNFFRRVKKGETPGFPKFAKKELWSSFRFKQGVGLCENTNKVKLPKIGKVKFKKSQEVIGVIKNTSIKKENKFWYICLTCEKETKHMKPNKFAIGLDLGIKELLISSEGEVYNNPKTLYKWSKRLACAQKSLSRKVKGSNNRQEAKLRVSKLHKKIANIRKDNLHKVTTKIINENQVIICEDLKVSNMLKNHKLARSIADASWTTLTNMLEYKSLWYGRTFMKVLPHHTSQDCNVCGYRNADLTLKVREWTCPDCNTHHDRDVNAAINILNKGMKKLTEAGHAFLTHGDIELNRAEAWGPREIIGATPQ
jgi:putative transposase